jgi:hypothetical protein
MFLIITFCSSVEVRSCFGRLYFLHLQTLFVAGFLLDFLFAPEDGCDIFLCRMNELPNYTVLQHRRSQHFRVAIVRTSNLTLPMNLIPT